MGFFDQLMRDLFGSKQKFPEYFVIDLETTGFSPTADRIIEISAIKVQDGKVVSTFTTLVDPEIAISPEMENLTHINTQMVVGAPKINVALPAFVNYVNNSILVGHNVPFDLRFLAVNCNALGLQFNYQYIDTLQLSRKVLHNLPKHRLCDLCAHFKIQVAQFHRSLNDCYATHECFQRLCNMVAQIEPQSAITSYNKPIKQAGTSKHIGQLIALLRDVMADGIIEPHEIAQLKSWINNHRELCGSYPFDMIEGVVDSADACGCISRFESDRLYRAFDQILNPSFRLSDPRSFSIHGMNFVLSGDFVNGEVWEIENALIARGGILQKSVTLKTNCIIVGSLGHSKWITSGYGTKIKRAMEINAKGGNILIVSELDVL